MYKNEIIIVQYLYIIRICDILNISKFLPDAIEIDNHDNIVLLWIEVATSHLKCIDC